MYENPQLPPVPQDTPNPYIMPDNPQNPPENEWARRRRQQLRGWATANPARVSTYDQAAFARSDAKPMQAAVATQGKPAQPTKPYPEYTDSQTAGVQPGKSPQSQQFGPPKTKFRPYNI